MNKTKDKKEIKAKVDDLVLNMKALYLEIKAVDDGSIEYADMLDVIVNGIGEANSNTSNNI